MDLDMLNKSLEDLQARIADLEQMKRQPELKVMFVDEEAKKYGLPIYRHAGDAGFDLHVILPEDERESGKKIFNGDRILLDTGMHIQLPQGYWGLIIHRSSTERKHRLRVVQGVIDQGYRGRIYTQVANDTGGHLVVNHGQRIAQMLILPVTQLKLVEADELAGSDRGQSGFGSTGAA